MRRFVDLSIGVLLIRHFEGRMTEKSHHQSPGLKATDFSTQNIIFKQKNPVRVFEMTRYLIRPFEGGTSRNLFNEEF